ncbi:MAG: hypothetical protein ACK587_09105, partial [Cyanobacteriota bacterium]
MFQCPPAHPWRSPAHPARSAHQHGSALSFIRSPQAEQSALPVRKPLLHGRHLLGEHRPEAGFEEAHLTDHLAVVAPAHAANRFLLHRSQGFVGVIRKPGHTMGAVA